MALTLLFGCSGMSTEHAGADDTGTSARGSAGANGLGGAGGSVTGVPSSPVKASSGGQSNDAPGSATAAGAGSPSDHGPAGVVAAPLSATDDPARISALPDCALAQAGRCVVPFTHTKDEVCQKLASDWPKQAPTDYVLPEGACTAASLGQGAKTDALRRLNYYRWLSNLAPVTQNDDWSTYAAACSVMQAHRDDPTHNPSPDTACYSDAGALGSSQSLIDLRAHTPADAIDDLVWDAGQRNSHEDGHRWVLLHPGLTEVGIGFAYPPGENRATCVRETAGGHLDRPKDLTGVVAYPSFGRTPYELISRESIASPVSDALEWSVTFDESVSVEWATARVYREGPSGYALVPATSGPIQTFHGLWIDLANGPATPGTYVVIVKGTGLGEFGYRTTIERCGADTPLTCDIAKQDCAVPGYGCYGPGAPYCAKSGNLPNGAACKGNLPSECAPGSACVENSSARDGYTCAAYCDPKSNGDGKSCDKLCRGNYVVFEDAEHDAVAGAYCDPSTGGSCDPLAPSCPAGQGCYGFKPPRCVAVGASPKGAECHFANDCAPGLACIGIEASKCLPYCDVKGNGPGSCKALCPAAYWDYDSFGICQR